MSNETEAPDPNIVEALAFELLHVKYQRVNEVSAAETVEILARECWQDTVEVRQTYRDMARAILSWLGTEAGCRIRVSDTKLNARRLAWMQTVPPRLAYSADELAGT